MNETRVLPKRERDFLRDPNAVSVLCRRCMFSLSEPLVLGQLADGILGRMCNWPTITNENGGASSEMETNCSKSFHKDEEIMKPIQRY